MTGTWRGLSLVRGNLGPERCRDKRRQMTYMRGDNNVVCCREVKCERLGCQEHITFELAGVPEVAAGKCTESPLAQNFGF